MHKNRPVEPKPERGAQIHLTGPKDPSLCLKYRQEKSSKASHVTQKLTDMEQGWHAYQTTSPAQKTDWRSQN